MKVVENKKVATDGFPSSPSFYIGYHTGFLATLFTLVGVTGIARYRSRESDDKTIPECSMKEIRIFRRDPTFCKKVQLKNETDRYLFFCKSNNPRGICFLDTVFDVRK